jgi:Fe-S oxidoreductase
MEEDPEKRVNNRRVDELISCGADCVATACPYCLTMFEDGLKAKQAEEKIKAKDISEIVAEALG